jgi:hypothetical protein
VRSLLVRSFGDVDGHRFPLIKPLQGSQRNVRERPVGSFAVIVHKVSPTVVEWLGGIFDIRMEAVQIIASLWERPLKNRNRVFGHHHPKHLKFSLQRLLKCADRLNLSGNCVI